MIDLKVKTFVLDAFIVAILFAIFFFARIRTQVLCAVSQSQTYPLLRSCFQFSKNYIKLRKYNVCRKCVDDHRLV